MKLNDLTGTPVSEDNVVAPLEIVILIGRVVVQPLQKLPGTITIDLLHQEVQIAKLPQRPVPVEPVRQQRPLERHHCNAFGLEGSNQPNQFRPKPKSPIPAPIRSLAQMQAHRIRAVARIDNEILVDIAGHTVVRRQMEQPNPVSF
ncbi:MAG: hypothetical protein IPK27_04055 [Rhodanobacteraceae bacterium]|nr:hypothetical protein [Rhodanobacteraceae bacterium]